MYCVQFQSSLAGCVFFGLDRLYEGAAPFLSACPRPVALSIIRVPAVLVEHAEM